MKKFNITINGYDKDEVNRFVNEVTLEYESMLAKLKDKDREIKTLNEQLERFKNIELTLNKAILIAEDSANQIKNVARDEAKVIIETAKKNASQIVNDALIKAEKTEIEVDQLRRSIKIYKSRIKQAIEDQLSMVDDVDNITLDTRRD